MSYKCKIVIKGLPDDEQEYEDKLDEIACQLSMLNIKFDIEIGEPE